VDAFSTPERLALLLKRDFTFDETTWVQALLEEASTYLRSVIGQDVFPTTTSTYTAYPSSGREDIPQYPVVSVDAVTRDDKAIAFTYRPGYILVDCDEPCEVTFTWGYAAAPEELSRLACVLVSQALVTLENNIGLTAGGLSSVALDDFKVAWADAGASSGMVLSEHAEASVRKQFGRGNTLVAESR